MHTATHHQLDLDLPGLPFASAHLVGIGGSGMKSLAELLQDLGCELSGSDRRHGSPTIRSMQRRNIRIDAGHDPHFVPPDCEALIYSPAIGPDNDERRMAARLEIPQYSLIDALAGLMASRAGLCVAGTHGKSTTTALIAWILSRGGLSPSAFIGAELCGADRGGWAGSGELFVVESCEYERHFLRFRPKHAVILGIEPDHFGTYPDEETLIDGFTRFAANVAPEGTLYIPADCPRSAAAVAEVSTHVQTFEPVAGFEAAPSLCGAHNQRNLGAAVAICRQVGLSDDVIQDGVATFPGIRRRFEVLGEWRGVTLVDDYAHHPTAVRVTLESARERFPGRRLWCVFQPHQIERTRRFFEDFAEALAIADVSLIAPVFAAREPTGSEAAANLSRELAGSVRSGGGDGRFISSLDRIRPTLDDEARQGDVVLLMGAGDIDRIAHEFAGRIPRNHAGQ